MPVLVAALLGALIPTTFYVLFVWWLDRYEKEPPWLLALAFVWGAGPAAALSVAFELVVANPISALGTEGAAAWLLNVGVSAPVVEETFKGIALIGLVLLFHREFDDVLDGIIFGAMIGFGFAFTENIVTQVLPLLRGQAANVGTVGIFVRTVIFGANHGFWTGITGAAVGYARLSRTWAGRLLAPLAGWTLAVLFHGIHNLGVSMVSTSSEGAAFCLPLGLALVLNWGGVLLLLLVAASALRRESGWIEQGLAEEVERGDLTPGEFNLLCSAWQRLWAQWQARSNGGRSASRAVGRYYQAATELAFARRHLRRDSGENVTLSGEGLIEIERLRRQFNRFRELALPWLRPFLS